MARIQILELPTEHHGDDMTTPFLLIVDRVEDPDRLRQDMNGAKGASGARGILAFQETIDIPANNITPPDADHTMHVHVTGDPADLEPQIKNVIESLQQRHLAGRPH